jgi:hypothetical protein
VAEQERYMRLRGDGINVNRYRISEDNAGVRLYLDVRGEYTLADLLSFTSEHAAPENVTFRGGCFWIDGPSTDEDRARWEQSDADRAARSLKHRRDWYERLREEFEPRIRPAGPEGGES